MESERMNTSFLVIPNGISRDEERDYAKALQFMGFDSTILFSYNPKKNMNQEIPQIKLLSGELLDKNNHKRKNNELISILDCKDMDEAEIMNITKKEKIDIIINLTPRKETKKIMQYPQSSFSEAFFQNLNNKSIMIGISHKILEDEGILSFNIYTARLAYKNKVPIIFDGFATNPNELRARNEYKGLLHVLGLKPEYYSESIKHFENVLKKEYYRSFTISVERKL